jgi:hypothetical protein
MPGTLGGSGASCYSVPELDASDPDSDIPDELQNILNANSDRGSDDDTFDFSKRFIRDEDDSNDVERPRSVLPPLSFSDLPSEILSAPVFSGSLSGSPIVVDESEHDDVDHEADTKQSFDFTGELRKLNESGNRHSFVEQLENAFRTPATLDLRCDLGGLLQVEVPPVPCLPLDLDSRAVSTIEASLDLSKSSNGNESAEASGVWQESTPVQQSVVNSGEPEAFDIYKVSQLVDNRPNFFARTSIKRDNSDAKKSTTTFPTNDTSRPPSIQEPSIVDDSSLETDSADGTGHIFVSADPTEDLGTSQRESCRPSNGELNMEFRFGGLPRLEEPEQQQNTEQPLTLSDIIPPPSHVRSLSSSSSTSMLEDDSLFRSILAKVPDDPQPRRRVASDASNRFLEVRQSLYRLSQASSVSSFTGFDSFEEVRRGFEFNSQRPGFYPPSSSTYQDNRHTRDSVMSIASVSSYGHVINPGVPDPFDFGLPSLQERPSSEDLSTTAFSIEDTFSFLNHASRRRKRVDSDASSFYFRAPAPRPGDRRRDSAFSVHSQAPPVSLFNRSFGGHRRGDSGASASSAWRRSHRFSADSTMSDFSAMRLGRPGIGDKMFETTDQAMPLTSISASPSGSTSESFCQQMFHQATSFDSIIDSDRRTSVNVSDSIFDKTGNRTSVSSEDSLFGHDNGSRFQPGLLPRHQYRPLSFMSATSVHSPAQDDDTMISVSFHMPHATHSLTNMIFFRCLVVGMFAEGRLDH